VFIGGLAFAVVLHVVDPSGATAFPVCPFYAVTGLYCHGCGTLRCLHALVHADLRAAIDYNVLTVFIAPVLVAAWLSVGLAGIRGQQVSRMGATSRWIGWAFGVTFVLFWILRNLTPAPVSWMAP
jgi:hypothetical protein